MDRALTRVNLLGLVDLAPRELMPADAELPVPNAALAPGELLDTLDQPLVRIVPSSVQSALSTTLANRILHQPIRGGAAAALLNTDAATRASHGVDDLGTVLLAEERWDEFLARRSDLLARTITDVVDRHAEWGARDRFSAAELLRTGRAGA